MDEDKGFLLENKDADNNVASTEKDGASGNLSVPSRYRGIRKLGLQNVQSHPSNLVGKIVRAPYCRRLLDPDDLCLRVTCGAQWICTLECLILFKPFSYLLGIDTSVRVTVMEVRLLGATFAGLAALSWVTTPRSYLVLRNVLVTHLMYFGLATLVFIRELFVEYNSYIMMFFLFHLSVFLITLLYVTKLRQMNQPIPDKPVSFAESDDNLDPF